MSGFLKGAISPSFFVMSGDLPGRDELEAALSVAAFDAEVDKLQKLKVDERLVGWLSGFSGEPTFGDINDWAPGNAYFLRIQLAEKKIKASEVAWRHRAALKAWVAENRPDVEPGEKPCIPRAVRAELKQAISEQICLQTAPTIRQATLVVLPDDKVVILDSQATWAVDLVRTMFRNLTGVSLTPETWGDYLPEEAVNGLAIGSSSSILQYVWRMTHEGGACVTSDLRSVEVWAENSATLVRGDDTTSIKADGSLPDKEVRSALKLGKTFSAVGVHIVDSGNGREATGQLAAASETISLKGIKLMGVDSMGDDLEATFADRLGLLLWTKSAINALVKSFAVERPSIWPEDEADGEVDGEADEVNGEG